jgi:hypothetical protein
MTESEAKAALAKVPTGVVLIDERSTLGQLKKEISNRLNVPVNEFRILKSTGVGYYAQQTIPLCLWEGRAVFIYIV